MEKSADQRTLVPFCFAIGVLCIVVLPIAAGSASEIYLRGQVVSADDGQPIDSVRVGSVLYSSIAMSDREGKFTLGKINNGVIHGNARGTRADRSIAIRCLRGQILIDPQPGECVTANVTDLRGRLISYAAYRNVSGIPVATAALTSGVYLLSLYSSHGYRELWQLLVSGDGAPAGLSTAGSTTATATTGGTSGPTAVSSAVSGDSVFFCRSGYYTVACSITGSPEAALVKMQKKRWAAFDIHNHTFLTDGSNTFNQVADSAFGIGGLDLIANSEHGSFFARDTAGTYFFPDSSGIYRWRTLADYSWPKVLGQRSRFPEKTILQGVEWDVPGHEHASVGFLDDCVPMPSTIADFEYMFGAGNGDTTVRPDLGRYNNSIHENALAGVEWLQRNFRGCSYCFLNHPGNFSVGTYSVSDLRDFNTTAPDVCIGFEGMPGHQKYPTRGKYNHVDSPPYRTYGGADLILTELGGVWDALLYEGRHFWPIVNSDFHNLNDDFWPGEYAKTRVAVAGSGGRAWLKGMQSGEMFVVLGDLIESLDFSVDDNINRAWMGAELHTGRHEVKIRIRFKCPARNNNGDAPQVDHIDLISGSIGGKIDPADVARYTDGRNATTRVVHRFSASNWHIADGWTVMDTTISVTGPTYFRLRGTNHPVGTPGELDAEGNPIVDELNINTAAVAWSDLWFYSNPVFVYVK